MSMATVCVFTFGIIRFRDLGSYDNISEQTKIADDEKNFDLSAAYQRLKNMRKIVCSFT
jgi:hypothetical protein